jgi:ferredoxin
MRDAPARSGRRAAPRVGTVITVDPISCDAFGYCTELLPELVAVDEWGYPVVGSEPVPPRLAARAAEAARQCPRRALHLRRVAVRAPSGGPADPQVRPASATSSGRTGARSIGRPVAARIAARTAGPDEMAGGSPTPFAP